MSRTLNRREVIKLFAFGSACSYLPGQSWSDSLIHELTPLSTSSQNGILRVDLGAYPALNQSLGSVRIGTSALDSRTHRAVGLFPPVVINRSAQGVFYAMSAECTHAGCTVQKLDPGSQRLVCPCHGSQFGIDGSLLQGPAGSPLLRYHLTQRGSILEIEMPDVFYEIQSARVNGTDRIKLAFIAFENITYEVHFRESANGAARRVPFATSPTGPVDRTEFPGNSDQPSLYVQRPGNTGFFQIVMKTQSV